MPARRRVKLYLSRLQHRVPMEIIVSHLAEGRFSCAREHAE